MRVELEKDFNILFGNNSIQTKIEILRKLNPINLDIEDIFYLINLVRSSVKNISFDTEYYGIFGTGGDRFKTINGSTVAAILASCEMNICKVGTIAVTSRWGSQNLIKYMGYKFTSSKKEIQRRIGKCGFCYVPTFKLGLPYNSNLINARKAIYREGIYDIIKVIVPAAHLMNPKSQITGVYDLKLVPIVAEIFRRLKKKGIIVHSYDGIDELSNTSKNLIIEINNGKTKEYEISPEELGIKTSSKRNIQEFKNIEHQLKSSLNILSGKDMGPKRDFIVMNAACLLYLSKRVKSLKDGVEVSMNLLKSGQVFKNFNNILKYQCR